jgi:hypothetical protein
VFPDADSKRNRENGNADCVIWFSKRIHPTVACLPRHSVGQAIVDNEVGHNIRARPVEAAELRGDQLLSGKSRRADAQDAGRTSGDRYDFRHGGVQLLHYRCDAGVGARGASRHFRIAISGPRGGQN